MDIALLKGTTAFIATNLDDLIILMLFFSQVSPNFRNYHIISGQYLGFSLLLLASLPGFLGGLVIPEQWIGLLGFLPLAIGVKLLLQPEAAEAEVQTVSEKFDQASASSKLTARVTQFLSPQVCKVAAVTVANGGDNISIYIPLFASSNPLEMGVILLVFLGMIAVWCFIAAKLVRHRSIAAFLSEYGERIIPLVFICLGLGILFESGTVQAISNFFR